MFKFFTIACVAVAASAVSISEQPATMQLSENAAEGIFNFGRCTKLQPKDCTIKGCLVENGKCIDDPDPTRVRK